MANTLCHDLTGITAPDPGDFLYLDTGTLDRKLTLNDAFATMMGWRNAKAMGIVGDGVTDDTAAIDAAFQTVIDAGGGTLYFPAGTYLLSSVQGGTGVAQVEFPVIGNGDFTSTTQQLTLRIVGALAPPTSGELTVLPVNGYTIFKSTVTTGTHTSIFRSAGVLRNNIHVIVENIILQAPVNPKYHGWDMRYQQDVSLRHLLVHSGVMGYANVTQPTNSAIAIALPIQNHAVSVSCCHCYVWNWPIGYKFGELLIDGIGLCAVACLEAFQIGENYHPSYAHSLIALECPRVIKAASAAACFVQIGMLDIEDANGVYAAWLDKVNHVDDNGTINGTLTYNVVLANGGPTTTFTKSNGANLICSDSRGFIAPVTVANLPAIPRTGMVLPVSDSNTVTWGATVAGGGANNVLASYNGSAWTVVSK